MTHKDLLFIDDPRDRLIFAKTRHDPPRLAANTEIVNKETPRAERTPAPQSCSPPENRGLSTGAEVAIEVSISCLTTSYRSTDPELGAVPADISRASATVPLCRMEYMQEPGSLGHWKETRLLPSHGLPVQLKVQTDSYVQLLLPQPQSQWAKPKSVDNQAIVDTGA